MDTVTIVIIFSLLYILIGIGFSSILEDLIYYTKENSETEQPYQILRKSFNLPYIKPKMCTETCYFYVSKFDRLRMILRWPIELGRVIARSLLYYSLRIYKMKDEECELNYEKLKEVLKE